MKAQEKGKGKKKPASRWTAKKIGIIIIGVGFAAIMVVSSLGMGWLVSMNPAAAGDGAVVDVTFFDGMDRPVLTTNPRTFNATFEAGNMVWLCGQFSTRVKSTSQTELISIPIYNYYYGEAKYALFSPEWDTISSELEGMKQGESRRITFPALEGFEREMTAEEFNGIGGNFTTVTNGDQVVLAFAENPEISLEENVTPSYVIRTGYVTAKTDEGIRVNYACPSAQISLVQLTKA
ncbi:MAG: hypothetical protein A4E40_01582 [Methanoregulaceae archaeon PtaU1.Bin059]|nr:MAG: hypothetical protein A4E36_01593 [Methanoregulaceae archaeon PtaB.Bin009]OPY35755.1 MAG: hypothetical protein A4E40_01582 [Methanoregulaceae archaeon PtaU1.Bin059]HII77310.1 hypothetical protein [Methanolinea sp.]HNQ28873.1 hypothetical protein [Methanolinea sp.]